MEKPSWDKISSKTLVKNNLFELQLHKVRVPSGKVIDDFVYITANDGVMVIPVTTDKKIIMLQHYKYAADDNFYLLPGGISENNEKPVQAAARELAEETGYSSQRIEQVGEIFTDPTNITIKTTVFVAHDCLKTNEIKLDAGENLEEYLISIDQMFSMLKNHQIKDGPTLAAIALGWDILKSK